MEVAITSTESTPEDLAASFPVHHAAVGIMSARAHEDMLELGQDPEAQAVLADFIEFTEYFPADQHRSLNLIEKNDRQAVMYRARQHELLQLYGKLPTTRGHKHDPAVIRSQIADCRAAEKRHRAWARAESDRMLINSGHHLRRSHQIHDKLVEIQKNLPSDEQLIEQEKQSQEATRAPKASLRGDVRRRGASLNVNGHKESRGERHARRQPLIIVPGEIIDPYVWEQHQRDWGSSSESEVDSEADDRPKPEQKLKISMSREAGPRPPKIPKNQRAPGSMGTNVHSMVAGISTSNALALLEKPPPDAPNGSLHKPWLKLSDYELATLRKRMKKNAVWVPSSTMIRRELHDLGRGLDGYNKAKADALARGEDVVDADAKMSVDDEGNQVRVSSVANAIGFTQADEQLINRGMKLNEAKKAKREAQAREQLQAATASEEFNQRLKTGLKEGISKLFSPTMTNKKDIKEKEVAPSPGTLAKITPVPKKRKEPVTVSNEAGETQTSAASTPAPAKRPKTETPVPAPPGQKERLQRLESSVSAPANGPVNTSIVTTTTTTTVPLKAASPSKSSTPILPPGKEKKGIKKEAMSSSSDSRIDSHITAAPIAEEQHKSGKASTSVDNADTLLSRRHALRGATMSAEPVPPSNNMRPRRPSTVPNTVPSTPIPEVIPSRPVNRTRSKKPAPGPIPDKETCGSAAVATKRSKAPSRKAGMKKPGEAKVEVDAAAGAEQMWDRIDEEGNVIDPSEPKYCLCNDVSYGKMICCENSELCEKEWFHLGCVGLKQEPPARTKWYCPDCRESPTTANKPKRR